MEAATGELSPWEAPLRGETCFEESFWVTGMSSAALKTLEGMDRAMVRVVHKWKRIVEILWDAVVPED